MKVVDLGRTLACGRPGDNSLEILSDLDSGTYIQFSLCLSLTLSLAVSVTCVYIYIHTQIFHYVTVLLKKPHLNGVAQKLRPLQSRFSVLRKLCQGLAALDVLHRRLHLA